MKVLFKQGVVGIRFAYRPKVVYDLPDKTARKFIRSGVAVESGSDSVMDHSVAESAQSAVVTQKAISTKPTPRKKKPIAQ